MAPALGVLRREGLDQPVKQTAEWDDLWKEGVVFVFVGCGTHNLLKLWRRTVTSRAATPAAA